MNQNGRVSVANGDHGQLRQVIVQSLLTEIFHGRISAGDRLVTQDLAERFQVSHTPIREALITLEGVGVIDLFPNRGAIVRQVTQKDVKEICHVRRVLECEAVRTACGKITLGELRELEAALDEQAHLAQPTPEHFLAARKLDTRLHDLIASSTGNDFLAKEIERLKMLFRAFRDVSWQYDESKNDFARLEIEANEHLAIVRALMVDERAQAVKAMSLHILSGIKYWARALPKAIPSQPTRSKRTKTSSSKDYQ